MGSAGYLDPPVAQPRILELVPGLEDLVGSAGYLDLIISSRPAGSVHLSVS